MVNNHEKNVWSPMHNITIFCNQEHLGIEIQWRQLKSCPLESFLGIILKIPSVKQIIFFLSAILTESRYSKHFLLNILSIANCSSLLSSSILCKDLALIELNHTYSQLHFPYLLLLVQLVSFSVIHDLMAASLLD